MGAIMLRAMGNTTPIEVSQHAFLIASAMEQQSKLEQ
jgi:hypothetical protein